MLPKVVAYGPADPLGQIDIEELPCKLDQLIQTGHTNSALSPID